MIMIDLSVTGVRIRRNWTDGMAVTLLELPPQPKPGCHGRRRHLRGAATGEVRPGTPLAYSPYRSR
jgi:hypothetical protein